MDRVKAFYGDNQVYFNTLTLQIDDNHDIMKYWHLFYMRLKYYYPHILIFWVKEYTRRGKAHIHYTTSRALDEQWVKRSWNQITGTSYIAKCGDSSSEIRSPAAYMLKYMTKAHSKLDLYQKGERIYGFLGAKAPPKKILGFESEIEQIILEQHFNIASPYWNIFYYLNMWLIDGKLIWVNIY